MASSPMFPEPPELVTCRGCGDRQPPQLLRLHVCDWWRWLDHQVDRRRDELDCFERELGAYLKSTRGRFDLWYAERDRERARPARHGPSNRL